MSVSRVKCPRDVHLDISVAVESSPWAGEDHSRYEE